MPPELKKKLSTELDTLNRQIFARRAARAELQQRMADLVREDEADNKRVMVIAATLLDRGPTVG